MFPQSRVKRTAIQNANCSLTKSHFGGHTNKLTKSPNGCTCTYSNLESTFFQSLMTLGCQ